MTPSILNWISKIRNAHPFAPGQVLEIGSRNVNGSPRALFADAVEYTGLDLEPGSGIDVVMDATQELPPGPFDTILCCEMLEHCADPADVCRGMFRVLSSGGILIVTSPANGFPEHRHPRDYWRLMPDTFREIVFRGCRLLDLFVTHDNIRCGFGRKL